MINIVLASDRNLIRQAGITALSAIEAASDHLAITFLTPKDDVAHHEWQSVIALLRHKGAECTLIPVTFDDTVQLAEHLNNVTYFRLLVAELLPRTIKRAIYLDCDVLVQRDLAELWASNLGEHALAAVPDAAFTDWRRLGLSPEVGYFNAGVVLLDLQIIRAQSLLREALEFAKHHPERLTWSDQCALNHVFQGRWHRLDQRWNYQYRAFVDDIIATGKPMALRFALQSVFHFNNYDRPWLPESAHPLKTRYLAFARSHPELNITSAMSPRAMWKRAKRTIKWRIPTLLRRTLSR